MSGLSALAAHTRRPALWTTATALALALAGCALRSPETRDQLAAAAAPNRQMPTQWQAGGSLPGISNAAVGAAWLQSFNDPQLDALVKEALAYNPDLQSAAARVAQAAAYQQIAGGLLYPQVNLLARGGGKLSGDASGIEGLGLFVNWELDLWGRVRAGAASANAQAASAMLDAEYARQSLAAQVAKGWFLATEARLQIALAQETLNASAQLEHLAQERLRIGVGDEYDLRLAQANLNTLRDTVQSLELSYQQALRSLETLAGRYPGATLQTASVLPALGTPVPTGIPSALLERRPDVVAAERRVAAAFYNTEQAKAARLPRLALSGAVTSISSEMFVLQERDNPVWSLGGAITAPLFSGGQLQGQVTLRTAEQKQALADYGRTGAKAFGEVENALASSASLVAREKILADSVNDNQAALGLADTRFRVGSTDLRPVLQQKLALYAAQVSLLHVRSEQRVQRVNLHLALGGSFDAPASDTRTEASN